MFEGRRRLNSIRGALPTFGLPMPSTPRCHLRVLRLSLIFIISVSPCFRSRQAKWWARRQNLTLKSAFNGQHPLGLPSTLEWPSLAGWYDENSTFLPPGQAHVSAFVYAYAQLSGAPPFLDTNGINQPQPPRVRRVRPPPGFEVASGYMYSTNELLMEPEISTRPVRTLMRPPPGFGFSPASRPVQIASGSPTGLRPSSRSRYNIQIRPPPGLGFSPRSRPRQFASGPPPGFENAPRSRKPTNIPAPGCCLTIAYRPAERKHPAGEQARLCSSPDFARREGDKPPGVSASLNAQTALESVSQVEVDRPEYSNLGVLLQYGRRSTKLQARGAARRAGREALRQEMEREDDEAQEARGESVESMG